MVIGSFWGAFASCVPEKGDTYVTPLRFLILFLGGLFSLFISNLIGWSGAGIFILFIYYSRSLGIVFQLRLNFSGPLAIVSSGFVAAFYWEKEGWPINKNPVSNLFRILWIFFEPILFAFTGAQITVFIFMISYGAYITFHLLFENHFFVCTFFSLVL